MSDLTDHSQAAEVDSLYAKRQREQDEEAARNYAERWMRVFRDELQRMNEEGVDPYIAWLSLSATTDWLGDTYRLGE